LCFLLRQQRLVRVMDLAVDGPAAQEPIATEVPSMEYLFLAGVLGLFLGALLGVFLMALLSAADRDRFPEPRPERTHTLKASWPNVPASSFAGIGGNRGGGTVFRLTEATHEVAGNGNRISPSPCLPVSMRVPPAS